MFALFVQLSVGVSSTLIPGYFAKTDFIPAKRRVSGSVPSVPWIMTMLPLPPVAFTTSSPSATPYAVLSAPTKVTTFVPPVFTPLGPVTVPTGVFTAMTGIPAALAFLIAGMMPTESDAVTKMAFTFSVMKVCMSVTCCDSEIVPATLPESTVTLLPNFFASACSPEPTTARNGFVMSSMTDPIL